MKYIQRKNGKAKEQKKKEEAEALAKSRLQYSPSMEADRDAKVQEDLSGKFKMPYDFYRRVLDLEKIIEKDKEKTKEPILKGLMQLYSEAIEYFGFVDQVERCGELQMRMQSILVRPYVLECLERYEKEHLEQEKQNPKPAPPILEATKKQMQEMAKKMQNEKRQRDSNKAVED